MKPATGTARYDKDTGILTISTTRKRGKKTVQLVVVYTVEDSRPDKRVANPAFTLTKANGETYHVSRNEWGVRCDCVDGERREKYGGGLCKHARSLQSVRLIP